MLVIPRLSRSRVPTQMCHRAWRDITGITSTTYLHVPRRCSDEGKTAASNLMTTHAWFLVKLMLIEFVYYVILFSPAAINYYNADSYRIPAAWHTTMLNLSTSLQQGAIKTRAASIALPRAQPLHRCGQTSKIWYGHSGCLMLPRRALHVSKTVLGCEAPTSS